MTSNSRAKRATRALMVATGENYTRARRLAALPASSGTAERYGGSTITPMTAHQDDDPYEPRITAPFPLDTTLEDLTDLPPLDVEARYRATRANLEPGTPDFARWREVGRLLDAPAWGRYATSRTIPGWDIATTRTRAMLGGWQVTVTGLRRDPEVGDVITLRARGGGEDLELSWMLTGTGRGVRRSAGAWRSGRRVQRTVSSVAGRLAEAATDRLAPGPCACCGRTAPPAANLDLSPIGLCAVCEMWHQANHVDQVAHPTCTHTSPYRRHRRHRRWWREDKRTEPDGGHYGWATRAGMETHATHAGLTLTAGLNTGDAGDPDAVIEFFHDWDTGQWIATRERHPGARHRPAHRKVTWQLDPDLARHELVEVLALLRAGETTCPAQYAAPRAPS